MYAGDEIEKRKGRSFDEGDNELGGLFMVVEKVATKK